MRGMEASTWRRMVIYSGMAAVGVTVLASWAAFAVWTTEPSTLATLLMIGMVGAIFWCHRYFDSVSSEAV